MEINTPPSDLGGRALHGLMKVVRLLTCSHLRPSSDLCASTGAKLGADNVDVDVTHGTIDSARLCTHAAIELKDYTPYKSSVAVSTEGLLHVEERPVLCRSDHVGNLSSERFLNIGKRPEHSRSDHVGIVSSEGLVHVEKRPVQSRSDRVGIVSTEGLVHVEKRLAHCRPEQVGKVSTEGQVQERFVHSRPDCAGIKQAVCGHVASDGNCLWRAAAKAIVIAGGKRVPWRRLKKLTLKRGMERRGKAWERTFRPWGQWADSTCLMELAAAISCTVVLDTEELTYQAGESLHGACLWLSLRKEHFEPLLRFQHVAEVWPLSLLTESPRLYGGGKQGAGLSVGEQVKRLQQISPQFAQAQLKGILAVAPALRKLLDAGANRFELKAKLDHEAERLRVSHARGEKAKDGPLPKPKPKSESQRRATGNAHVRTIERKDVKLVPHQLFHQQTEVPIRPVLVGGNMPGVSLGVSQEHITDTEKRLQASAAIQVLVSPKKYQVSQSCQVLQSLLRFSITTSEAGKEQAHDADLAVYLYVFGGQTLEIRTLATEVHVKVTETHVVRVKLTKATMQPKVWVPLSGSARDVDTYLKEHASELRHRLRDMWQVARSSNDGSALARVRDEDLLRVMELAQAARVFIQPPKPVAEQMAVLWFPSQPATWHQAELMTQEL
eukprot:445369-Amphidinium_carterae.1